MKLEHAAAQNSNLPNDETVRMQDGSRHKLCFELCREMCAKQAVRDYAPVTTNNSSNGACLDLKQGRVILGVVGREGFRQDVEAFPLWVLFHIRDKLVVVLHHV